MGAELFMFILLIITLVWLGIWISGITEAFMTTEEWSPYFYISTLVLVLWLFGGLIIGLGISIWFG